MLFGRGIGDSLVNADMISHAFMCSCCFTSFEILYRVQHFVDTEEKSRNSVVPVVRKFTSHATKLAFDLWFRLLSHVVVFMFLSPSG